MSRTLTRYFREAPTYMGKVTIKVEPHVATIRIGGLIIYARGEHGGKVGIKITDVHGSPSFEISTPKRD